MDLIEKMYEENKDTVIVHGWVNKETLKRAWAKAQIWFYPCSFKETACLTGFEAAASKTMAISSDLAALQETVGNKGVMIPGLPNEPYWGEQALKAVFSALEDKTLREKYIEKNYAWAKSICYENVVKDFVGRFVEV